MQNSKSTGCAAASPGELRKLVFLDLEDTVIDAFKELHESKAMNHRRVREFLAREAPAEVHLFSFALSNEADVDQFRLCFKNWLDQSLETDILVDDVFTTRKLFDMSRRHGVVYESENECMVMHGKSYGFQRYIEMSPQFRDCELVLLDDAVEPLELFYPKRNLKLRLINVTDI
jgi:hypothetical protein